MCCALWALIANISFSSKACFVGVEVVKVVTESFHPCTLWLWLFLTAHSVEVERSYCFEETLLAGRNSIAGLSLMGKHFVYLSLSCRRIFISLIQVSETHPVPKFHGWLSKCWWYPSAANHRCRVIALSITLCPLPLGQPFVLCSSNSKWWNVGSTAKRSWLNREEGRKCLYRVTGWGCIVLRDRLGFVAACDVFVHATELGTETLSVIVLLSLLCLVTFIIVFLMKTVS